MNKAWRAALLLGAIVLAFGIMGIVGRGSHARRTLEQYKAELRAKGEKLTYAELTRLRIAHTNDSLARLTNAVARLRSGNQKPHPAHLQPRKYVGPGQAQVTWQQEHPFDNGSGAASTHAIWQEFDSELTNLAQPLAAIRQALQEPAPDAGLRTNFAISLVPTLVAIRSAALWLQGAALNEAHQGHVEAALQNVEALAGLSRVNREEYSLVSQMIRIAVANVGFAVTWEVLQAPGWSESQLERLQRAWGRDDMLDALETGFLGQRAGGLEMWTRAHQSGARQFWQSFNGGSSAFETVTRDYVLFPAYKLTSINDDELFHLQALQESLEALRLLKTHQPARQALQALDKTTARVNQMARSPDRLRYWLSLMAIPNMRKAVQTGLRSETERQLTLTAIALQRYHLRYGQWPPDLAALVPQFMPAIGYDPLSGQPLRYRLKADSAFLLYSVGEDGQDDGGEVRPAAGKTFGLWEGRDAVWPAAVPKSPSQ